MYWEYFKYVCEHKKNVFVCCFKESKNWFRGGRYREGMFYLWHGITHDLSKFSPSEFKAYAENFYGVKDCRKCESYMNCDYNQIGLGANNWAKECIDYKYKGFKNAWVHHYKNNKHHWNYWYDPIMNTCQDMPYKYIRQMILDWLAMSLKFGGTPEEYYLNNYNDIILSDETRMWVEYELGLNDSIVCNYGHTLKQFAKLYDKETFNNCFGHIKDKYNKDIYNELRSK